MRVAKLPSTVPPTLLDFKAKVIDAIDKAAAQGKVVMVLVADFDDGLTLQDAGSEASEAVRQYGGVVLCKGFVARPAIVDIGR